MNIDTHAQFTEDVHTYTLPPIGTRKAAVATMTNMRATASICVCQKTIIHIHTQRAQFHPFAQKCIVKVV